MEALILGLRQSIVRLGLHEAVRTAELLRSSGKRDRQIWSDTKEASDTKPCLLYVCNFTTIWNTKTRQYQTHNEMFKRNNVRRLREIRGKKTRGEGLMCHFLVALSQPPAFPCLYNPPKSNHFGMPFSIYPPWMSTVSLELPRHFCALFILQSWQYCGMDSQCNRVEIPHYDGFTFYICMSSKLWSNLKQNCRARGPSFEYVNNIKSPFCK